MSDMYEIEIGDLQETIKELEEQLKKAEKLFEYLRSEPGVIIPDNGIDAIDSFLDK